MVWTQKELDELRRSVEEHVQAFTYPYEDVSPPGEDRWALAVRIANLPIVVTPAPERKLIDVGIAFEVPDDIKRRFASMEDAEREAALGRVKIVCLNKGVEYTLNIEANELESIVLQQHLVPNEMTAQRLLNTVSRIKDCFYVLLVVDDLISTKPRDSTGPKSIPQEPPSQNIDLPPPDGKWNFIPVREPSIWTAWESACKDGETPGESLARVMSEAGYAEE